MEKEPEIIPDKKKKSALTKLRKATAIGAAVMAFGVSGEARASSDIEEGKKTKTKVETVDRKTIDGKQDARDIDQEDIKFQEELLAKVGTEQAETMRDLTGLRKKMGLPEVTELPPSVQSDEYFEKHLEKDLGIDNKNESKGARQKFEELKNKIRAGRVRESIEIKQNKDFPIPVELLKSQEFHAAAFKGLLGCVARADMEGFKDIKSNFQVSLSDEESAEISKMAFITLKLFECNPEAINRIRSVFVFSKEQLASTEIIRGACYGLTHFLAEGKFDEAIKIMKDVPLSQDDMSEAVHSGIIRCLRKDKINEAIQVYEKFPVIGNWSIRYESQLKAYLSDYITSGNFEKAEKLKKGLEIRQGSFDYAVVESFQECLQEGKFDVAEKIRKDLGSGINRDNFDEASLNGFRECLMDNLPIALEIKKRFALDDKKTAEEASYVIEYLLADEKFEIVDKVKLAVGIPEENFKEMVVLSFESNLQGGQFENASKIAKRYSIPEKQTEEAVFRTFKSAAMEGRETAIKIICNFPSLKGRITEFLSNWKTKSLFKLASIVGYLSPKEKENIKRNVHNSENKDKLISYLGDPVLRARAVDLLKDQEFKKALIFYLKDSGLRKAFMENLSDPAIKQEVIKGMGDQKLLKELLSLSKDHEVKEIFIGYLKDSELKNSVVSFFSDPELRDVILAALMNSEYREVIGSYLSDPRLKEVVDTCLKDRELKKIVDINFPIKSRTFASKQ